MACFRLLYSSSRLVVPISDILLLLTEYLYKSLKCIPYVRVEICLLNPFTYQARYISAVQVCGYAVGMSPYYLHMYSTDLYSRFFSRLSPPSLPFLFVLVLIYFYLCILYFVFVSVCSSPRAPAPSRLLKCPLLRQTPEIVHRCPLLKRRSAYFPCPANHGSKSPTLPKLLHEKGD